MDSHPIITAIERKAGVPDLAALLAERLSGSELNSLLMEVYKKRVAHTTPENLLKQYQANRLVQPAETDMIGLLQQELEMLEFLRDHSFQPLELSPAAQLGSCSIVGTVGQDKIISATRHTEIMADATNSLALHIAAIKKSAGAAAQASAAQGAARVNDEVLRFSTIHRHLRTQELKVKGLTPHFKIGCMVSSGRDTGGYGFETTQLPEHIRILDSLLREIFGIQQLRVKLQRREGYADPDRLLQTVADQLKKEHPNLGMTIEEGNNNYYKGIQFKIIITINNREFEIADGGFVDWTQKLLGNPKERLLISGFGLGMLYKFKTGLT